MISMQDIMSLLPEIILAVTAIIVMLGIAVRRSHLFSAVISALGIVVSFYFLVSQASEQKIISNLFIIDGLGNVVTGIILCATFVIVLISYPYFQVQKIIREEYYVLLLLATLGSVGMVLSHHFISFVLSLEVLSVSLFALIAYLKHENFSIESGIKYLIMAAVATSFILFGFALIYMATGSMDLQSLGGQLQPVSYGPLLLAGLALTIVGLGFKMALVPFHLWTPDIYAGASAPVTAFVATISKGAAFIFLLRLFYSIGGLSHEGIWIAFAVIATASMFIGNWLALRQQNLKRLLAYSSISHLGYLMVAFLSASVVGTVAGVFYLIIYFTSMLAAMTMITYFSNQKGEAMMVEDYRGLFWKKPWLAAFFTVVMLSLAGVPLTAGFMGKFFLLSAGMANGGLFLLIVLVVSSTIGLFYYLRVVAVMLSHSDAVVLDHIGSRSFVLKLLIAALFILILWLGIYPSLFVEMLGQVR